MTTHDPDDKAEAILDAVFAEVALEQEQLARDIGEAIYWACRKYGNPVGLNYTGHTGDTLESGFNRGQFILTTLTAKGYYLKKEGA